MMRNSLIIVLAIAGVASVMAAESVERHGCAVKRHGSQVELQSPAFVFALDTENNLRARSWMNQLTGRRISLGLGSEAELDFDAAEKRIWITGWKEEGSQRTTHVFLPLD